MPQLHVGLDRQLYCVSDAAPRPMAHSARSAAPDLLWLLCAAQPRAVCFVLLAPLRELLVILRLERSAEAAYLSLVPRFRVHPLDPQLLGVLGAPLRRGSSRQPRCIVRHCRCRCHCRLHGRGHGRSHGDRAPV